MNIAPKIHPSSYNPIRPPASARLRYVARRETMNLEGGLLLFLAPIFVLPAIYWLTRLANWIAGRKLIPIWLPFALFAVALVLGSLYLDNAGIVTQVKVRDKSDVISYGKNGKWSRNLSLNVEYQPPDELTT